MTYQKTERLLLTNSKNVAMFMLIFVMTSIQAGRTWDSVTKRNMVPDSQITMLGNKAAIMLCARLCLARQRSESGRSAQQFIECLCHHVNEYVVSSSSELDSDIELSFFDISGNGASCSSEAGPFNSLCDPVNKTHYDCSVTDCFGMKRHLKKCRFRVILPLICAPGFVPRGVVMCQNNVTWLSPVCASVSSCSMVKRYQPRSEDGEFWLRLPNFDNYVTRIYCHRMTSPTPHEYLTLRYPNHGIYPSVSNFLCTGDQDLNENCTSRPGKIQFNKIHVNVNTMMVMKADKEFATAVNDSRFMAYGEAYDCYTHHLDNELRCGTRGRFTIDLRETGWRVSENQQWEAVHFLPMIERIDRQMNGTLTHISCGGFDGGCRPIGGLFLTPNRPFSKC